MSELTDRLRQTIQEVLAAYPELRDKPDEVAVHVWNRMNCGEMGRADHLGLTEQCGRAMGNPQ